LDTAEEATPTEIERRAARMLGDLAARVADRHARDALRAELRRLAREWDLRIRTWAYGDRGGEPLIVTALRVTDMSCDIPRQRAIAKRVRGLD
jgi:hypothetical protein